MDGRGAVKGERRWATQRGGGEICTTWAWARRLWTGSRSAAPHAAISQRRRRRPQLSSALRFLDHPFTFLTPAPLLITLQGRAKTKQQDGGATVMTGGLAPAAAAAAVEAQQAKQRQHGDFYRFQARDRRRDELLNLQHQFEADKKRIAELRASRRFKPY